MGSGPDPDASRVIVAAILARDLALGKGWSSQYHGSLPFGTLDKGEASGIRDLTSLTFFLGAEIANSTRPPSSWPEFWEAHSGGSSPAPEVDWGIDMVVVVGDGTRREAGDSLEVRRVLQVSNGGQIEPVERAPGDFCSPASRVQTPFHIVVTPRVPPPIRFSDLRVERVPCGV